MMEEGMCDVTVTHLEMNGAGESKPNLGRCTLITLKSVIYSKSFRCACTDVVELSLIFQKPLIYGLYLRVMSLNGIDHR